MFTGIVECTAPAQTVKNAGESIRLTLPKPKNFSDVEVGHSVSVNGVCLTVEAVDDKSMEFCLGYETLKVLGWSPSELQHMQFNLERALLASARLHGHWVTGHVDGLALLKERRFEGECLLLSFEVPKPYLPFVWKKGAATLNGVSLTVNDVIDDRINVCLIPETLRRTNLASVKVGDAVSFEADYLAKAAMRMRELL